MKDQQGFWWEVEGRNLTLGLVPNPQAHETRHEQAHGGVSGKKLPIKKKEYVEYSDMEWEDLAWERNLIDEMLRNIVTKVEQDKGGVEWLDHRGNLLNPTQRDVDPASTLYVQAVEKFAMVKVRGVNSKVGVNFSVEVAATLKDALTTLSALDRSSKPEVVVIFSYDTQDESLYIWPGDVIIVNTHILWEEKNQDQDAYDPSTWVLQAPAILVCDSAGTVKFLPLVYCTAVWEYCAAALQADTSIGTQEVRLLGCQHLGWWQCHSPGSGKFLATQFCILFILFCHVFVDGIGGPLIQITTNATNL